MRIAQRFNAGFDDPRGSVPKGRLRPAVQQPLADRVFSRPFGTRDVRGILPRVETRGYFRLSLRDTAKRRGIYAVKNSVVRPTLKEGLTFQEDQEHSLPNPTARVWSRMLHALRNACPTFAGNSVANTTVSPESLCVPIFFPVCFPAWL